MGDGSLRSTLGARAPDLRADPLHDVREREAEARPREVSRTIRGRADPVLSREREPAIAEHRGAAGDVRVTNVIPASRRATLADEMVDGPKRTMMAQQALALSD